MHHRSDHQHAARVQRHDTIIAGADELARQPGTNRRGIPWAYEHLPICICPATLAIQLFDVQPTVLALFSSPHHSAGAWSIVTNIRLQLFSFTDDLTMDTGLNVLIALAF